MLLENAARVAWSETKVKIEAQKEVVRAVLAGEVHTLMHEHGVEIETLGTVDGLPQGITIDGVFVQRSESSPGYIFSAKCKECGYWNNTHVKIGENPLPAIGMVLEMADLCTHSKAG